MKKVYGNIYFCKNALCEVPLHIRDAYQKALTRLPVPFYHNLIKVGKELMSVTLLWYPKLEECAHPYLNESIFIPLQEHMPIKHKRESQANPVILHRVEEMLESNNPRIPYLRKLTEREEKLGFYSKKHIRFIGRRRYWNYLCRQVNLFESLAPEQVTNSIQGNLFGDFNYIPVIKRKSTAMPPTRPSGPTRWAYFNKIIRPVVLDWGCGKGRDSIWLKKQGIEVISYDPFYKPEPHPTQLNYEPIRTILLNYILNVIEILAERQKLLKDINSLANRGTRVLVSVRTKDEIQKQAIQGRWKKYMDGYITSRNTFQKGYTIDELTQSCKTLGDMISINKISGGIVSVISIT